MCGKFSTWTCRSKGTQQETTVVYFSRHFSWTDVVPTMHLSHRQKNKIKRKTERSPKTLIWFYQLSQRQPNKIKWLDKTTKLIMVWLSHAENMVCQLDIECRDCRQNLNTSFVMLQAGNEFVLGGKQIADKARTHETCIEHVSAITCASGLAKHRCLSFLRWRQGCLSTNSSLNDGTD